MHARFAGWCSCSSTNVDYLLFHTTPEGYEKWVFLELKTAPGSIGQEQLANYRRSVEGGMPAHVTGRLGVCFLGSIVTHFSQAPVPVGRLT